MESGERVSPVPWSPPVYASATVTNSPDTLRKPSSRTPRPTTTGSVMPNGPSRARGIVTNSTPIAAASPRPTLAATRTPCRARSGRCAPRVWPAPGAGARPEVLTRQGGGGAHEPDGGPGDEREQLRVAHRIGGLRLGALRQRSDEPEQQHAGHVHRDPLHPRRQAEAEQRPDDAPVGPPVHPAVPHDRQPPRKQQIHGHAAHGQARHGGADGGAG